MRHLTIAFVPLAIISSSCSQTERVPIQQVSGDDERYSFVLYRRGAVSTNYLTIEQLASPQESLVSVSYCDAIAARTLDNRLDVIGFNARMSVGRLDHLAPGHATEIRLRAYGHAPSQADLRSLAAQGFSTIPCKTYL